MSDFANAMEIFKLLDKSNCGDCGEKTCLAFAGAVFQARRQLNECPKLSPETIEKFGGQSQKGPSTDAEMLAFIENMKSQIQSMDLPALAERTGGRMVNNQLAIKTLGKDIRIDAQGNLSSDIHLHHWITMPLYSYLVDCQGVPLSGEWVPFRELKDGKSSAPLFAQRCEKPLKKVADTYTELFEDMVHLFNGRRVERHYQADISLVLHPLPLVPILVCYWKPEEGMESSLHLFYDANVEENLNTRAVYTLTAGLVVMFEKISMRHGIAQSKSAAS